MLAEWIEYLATPCPRHLRAMGYATELIGIKARYRRCRRAWASHLDACKAFILEAADACERRRKAVVLGSGVLVDVPVAGLADRFGEVVLVDILHLPSTRLRTRRRRNVRYATADLSGVARAAHDHARGVGPAPVPVGDLPESDADLVVSVNLLSQLPLLPCEYLERHGIPGVGDLARAVIEHHLAVLARSTGVVCLVTEIERLIMEEGGVRAREDPLAGVHLRAPDREWPWDLAPRPEADSAYDVRYRVAGFRSRGPVSFVGS